MGMGVITELITLLDDVLGYFDPHIHRVHMRAISHSLVMILVPFFPICLVGVFGGVVGRYVGVDSSNFIIPEGELDIVVMICEHGLRSPVRDPGLGRTDVQTAEVSVAAVATLVVDVPQDGSVFLTVPHPGQADPAGQQGVRRGSAQDKLGRTGHFYTNQV